MQVYAVTQNGIMFNLVLGSFYLNNSGQASQINLYWHTCKIIYAGLHSVPAFSHLIVIFIQYKSTGGCFAAQCTYVTK
jgi:hypothetical protein